MRVMLVPAWTPRNTLRREEMKEQGEVGREVPKNVKDGVTIGEGPGKDTDGHTIGRTEVEIGTDMVAGTAQGLIIIGTGKTIDVAGAEAEAEAHTRTTIMVDIYLGSALVTRK